MSATGRKRSRLIREVDRSLERIQLLTVSQDREVRQSNLSSSGRSIYSLWDIDGENWELELSPAIRFAAVVGSDIDIPRLINDVIKHHLKDERD